MTLRVDDRRVDLGEAPVDLAEIARRFDPRRLHRPVGR